MTEALRLRASVRAADAEAVRRIVTATGHFTPAETDVAVELVEERRRRGLAAGYRFLFADVDGCPVGYACYGPVPATAASFDLYWIAVDPARQGRGVGRLLLRRCEAAVRRLGGAQLYIETSARALYDATRRFYARAGYREAARLDDFYAPGDAKIIYCKRL